MALGGIHGPIGLMGFMGPMAMGRGPGPGPFLMEGRPRQAHVLEKVMCPILKSGVLETIPNGIKGQWSNNPASIY